MDILPKRLFIFVFLLVGSLMFTPIFPQTNAAILVSIEGKLCDPKDETPFSGPVFALHPNGEKWFEGKLKEGYMDGGWTYWFDNGEKQCQGVFKYNEKVGKWVYWDKAGKIESVDYLPVNFEGQDILPATQALEVLESSNVGKQKPVMVSTPFIDYDNPPVPLSRIRPVYPSEAKRAGITGKVVITFFVDSKGKVTETIIAKGVPNSGLDEAAEKAIKKVHFKPAKKDGEPVGIWISIPMHFRLH